MGRHPSLTFKYLTRAEVQNTLAYQAEKFYKICPRCCSQYQFDQRPVFIKLFIAVMIESLQEVSWFDTSTIIVGTSLAQKYRPGANPINKEDIE
jgi:hypothetical protein